LSNSKGGAIRGDKAECNSFNEYSICPTCTAEPTFRRMLEMLIAKPGIGKRGRPPTWQIN